MKNNTSKEALFARMRMLAEVNKTSLNESKTRTLGTLIDYKRAADGITYGIVKENHHYYIKKGGTKSDPDVTDFAYIGGLANITNYQYKSLSEADKNRNMLLHTINEAHSLNMSKKKINEDRAEDEIGSAEARLGDLEAATAAENEPDDVQMAAGLEAEPMGEPASAETEPEVPAEEPAPEGGEELPAEEPAPEGGEDETEPEVPAEEPAPEDGEEVPGDENVPADGEDETIRELEKSIGKLTNVIRKTDLEPSQSKSYLKSLIQSFKDKLPELEIEDRKEIANLITKVVPPEDVEDLSSVVPQDDEEGMEEGACNECGSFAKYAESRGYGSADALMECGEEEVGNLVSGYANANADGMNSGDHENVALVIKLINPEILNSLRNDYGHEEYADKLTPYVQGMNEETEEEGYAKLNELFGGLKALGGAAKKAVGQKYQAAKEKVGQAVQGVTQTYHGGEVAGELEKVTGLANELKLQMDVLNTRLQKAGKNPIDTGMLISGIANQIRANQPINAAATPEGEKVGAVSEGMTDPANVQVQSLQEDDDDVEDVEIDDTESTEEKPEIDFAPAAQTLGAGVTKPDGAPTTISVTSKDGAKVDVSLSEVVKKLREVLAESKVKEGNAFTDKLAKTPKGKDFKLGDKKMKDTSDYDKENIKEETKPSAGLSKEKKSAVVKKAKAGADIGKKGKGFKDVEKAAKKGGAEDPKAVAAAAMWKNIKREGVEETKKENVDESFIVEGKINVREYTQHRLAILTGRKKESLNESEKPTVLKQLDELIEKQFNASKARFMKK